MWLELSWSRDTIQDQDSDHQDWAQDNNPQDQDSDHQDWDQDQGNNSQDQDSDHHDQDQDRETIILKTKTGVKHGDEFVS